MEPKPFDFSGLSKEIFANWKAFFRDNFVFTKVINTKEISDPVVEAIQNKEIPIVSADDISSPIVDALYKVQEAVENREEVETISVKNIEQARTDMTDVISVLKDILEKDTQEIVVNPAKNDVTIDLKSITDKLEELKKAIPKIEKSEIKDYSSLFSEIVDTIKTKKEPVDYSKLLLSISDVLSLIYSKPEEEPIPFEFDDLGRLKVNVDRAGGGGGGLTQIESEKLQTLATEETLTAFKNKLPLTAFGDLRTAELSPIFQGSFEYTVDNTELTENSAVAPATVTQANGMAVVTTSTTAGKKASLKSKTHAKYMAGLGGLLRFTAIFTTPVAGTFQWAGIMDELGSTASFKNGFSIGYNGTSLCIARFQNDVLFQVNRDSWDDKLDGTGASGMTIDTTKLNVFEIRFQYLGGGAIQFFVEDDSTGNFVVFHKILYANLNTSPSVYNPNFHYFIFADNGATTNSIVVKSASYAYFIEGKSELSEIHQPQFSSGAKQKSAVTSEVAIFTIKVKTSYAGKTNFIPILIENIGASIEASSANNLGIIRLVKNTTLGGVPFYSDINTTDSVVSIDTAGITVTGGKTLMSFQLAGKNDKINERLLDLKLILQDGDTITLTGSSANLATINGNILWKELF